MSRADNDYKARIQGMVYAYRIAKEKGIEELERDIRLRGLVKAPFNVSVKEMETFWNSLSANQHMTMLLTVAVVLNEHYGFGKKRLLEFKEHWDKAVKDVLDLDYIGEHYVSFLDYARDLNERYNLGIDIDIINTCQVSYDDSPKNKEYHYAKIERVIEELDKNGMEDAAEYLRGKLST